MKDEDIKLSDEERQPCEIWTRVMGYHRPISSFNIGKKGEAMERKNFTEQAAARHYMLYIPTMELERDNVGNLIVRS